MTKKLPLPGTKAKTMKQEIDEKAKEIARNLRPYMKALLNHASLYGVSKIKVEYDVEIDNISVNNLLEASIPDKKD